MGKHTPGPWKSQWNGNWLVQTAGGWLVAKVAAPKAKGNFSPENVEANARLITAAPELLVIAEELVALRGKWDSIEDRWERYMAITNIALKARAAITKAKGE